MSDWYFAGAKEDIGGYHGIKNRATQEIALVGMYGEIYMWNDTICAAWIHSHKIINNYTNPTERYKQYEERVIKFPLSEIKKWVRILKVKKNRVDMIKKVEKFRELSITFFKYGD